MARVAIVGGGNGGTAILRAIYPLHGVQVAGIAEINETAPGVVQAKQWKIPVYSDFAAMIRSNALDIIIEATGSPKIKEALQREKRPETSLIDSHAAHLMMDLVASREQLVTAIMSRAQELAAVGHQLQTTSGQLVAKAGALAEEAESVSCQGRDLRDASGRANDSLKETGTILRMIVNVAAQTKLLGINAAIEAARAGEQGRGFTVVAQEIRKLAENSAASAGKVDGIIHQIQESMGAIIEGVAQTAAVIQHQTQASEELAESSRVLNDIANQVLRMAEHLTSVEPNNPLP